jgi:hypothetical protein
VKSTVVGDHEWQSHMFGKSNRQVQTGWLDKDSYSKTSTSNTSTATFLEHFRYPTHLPTAPSINSPVHGLQRSGVVKGPYRPELNLLGFVCKEDGGKGGRRMTAPKLLNYSITAPMMTHFLLTKRSLFSNGDAACHKNDYDCGYSCIISH